jgi:group II intron reverse transcriptase/maturase
MKPEEGKTMRDLSPEIVSTRLQRIAEMARRLPGKALTTLAHHIDIEFLKEAFRRTRKDGAVGVDGQTAEAYAADLESNLGSLLDRLKTGTYRAPPVRRVHIPKGDGGETRPIGIPTFEDKVLQRAVTMALEAVYEQDFLPCSYGFRPGRSVHDALDALWKELMQVGGGWVIEVDIAKFYDSIVHSTLRELLDHRVRDGVLRRVIHKWMRAGVLELGVLTHPELGTPQGGVVSPLLANVYLHEAVDVWFERDVKPRMRGHVALIRYADDFVIVCEREDDARRVLEVLPKRLEKYGLSLHSEKTRLVRFRRPPRRRDDRGSGDGTFDFLGFRHFWGLSRKGSLVVKRKTAPSRFTRALRKVNEWLRTHSHWRIAEQQKALGAKLRGHYGFYGVTGNVSALKRFADEVRRVWRKWLNRRSQRRKMPWDRFQRLLNRYPLPPPRVVHSIYRRVANS